MKCTKCGDFVETVGQVRTCQICAQENDGTGRQVPKGFADTAAIEALIVDVPGLGNRFVLGHAPPLAEVTKDPDAESILRDRRARASAESAIVFGHTDLPFDEVKRQKIEQERREERERDGTNGTDGTINTNADRLRLAKALSQTPEGERDADADRVRQAEKEEKARLVREANERAAREAGLQRSVTDTDEDRERQEAEERVRRRNQNSGDF